VFDFSFVFPPGERLWVLGFVLLLLVYLACFLVSTRVEGPAKPVGSWGILMCRFLVRFDFDGNVESRYFARKIDVVLPRFVVDSARCHLSV
jgi:hypothetical protein